MIDTFVKYVSPEFDAIAKAPFAFVLCIAVISAIIWRLQAWRYAGSIDSLEGRNKLQADQIIDYKNKLSGASPEEARNRMDALELQLKSLMPRRLTVDERQIILGMIRNKTGIISVTMDGGASEARGFANDIMDTFDAAGWFTTYTFALGIDVLPVSGLAIYREPDGTPDEGATLMMDVLRAAHISFDVITNAVPADRLSTQEDRIEVRILIGPRMPLPLC